MHLHSKDKLMGWTVHIACVPWDVQTPAKTKEELSSILAHCLLKIKTSCATQIIGNSIWNLVHWELLLPKSLLLNRWCKIHCTITWVLLWRYVKPTRLYSTLNWKTPYTSGSLNLAKKKPSAKENNTSEW